MKRSIMFGKIYFVLFHILLAFNFWQLYYATLFQPLRNHGTIESVLLLGGCVLLTSVVGILYQIKDGRNYFNAVVNVGCGFAIYHGMTYIPFQHDITFIVLPVFLMISTVVSIFDLPNFHPRHKPRFLLKTFGEAYRTAALAFVAILVTTVVSTHFKTETPASTAYAQEVPIQTEQIALLRNDNWSTLDTVSKVQVLQTIADMEQSKLGIPFRMTVIVEDLPGNELGCYKDDTKTISIDEKHLALSSQWRVVITVCHESYHCYQHRLVQVYHQADATLKELPCFGKAKQYEYELCNYVNGDDDMDTYSEQALEIDAREYAEKAAYEYYQQVVGA